MIQYLRGFRGAVGCLVAVGVVALLPALAWAEKVSIRNDTPGPVIIRVSCVNGQLVVRDKPVQVAPGGETSTDLPGNRLINIVDPRGLQTLLQTTLPGGKEGHFLLKLDARGKVYLEPTKPPH